MRQTKTYEIRYFGGPSDGDRYFFTYKPPRYINVKHQIGVETFGHTYEIDHMVGEAYVYNYKGAA